MGEMTNKDIEAACMDLKDPLALSSPPGSSVSGIHCLVKLLSVGISCLFVLYCMYLLRDYIQAVLIWTEHQPTWKIIFIFVALFTLVSLPLAWGYIVVNLACGYIFGLLPGLLVTICTATIGILIAHVINKTLLGPCLRRILTNSDLTKSLYLVISGPQAFKLIALTRFTPVPFGLQNAVFSISSLSTSRYIAASMVGLLPTQTLNVYIGSTLRSMEEVVTNDPGSGLFPGWMLLVVQLLVSLLVGMWVVRKARGELDKAITMVGEGAASES